MRRCLHAFLVGVLSLAMTTDTARGCWYLRRVSRAPRPCVITCPPPRECGMMVVSDVVVDGWQGDATSASGCDCNAASVVADELVSVGEPAVEAPLAAPAAQPPVAPPDTVLPTLKPASEPVPVEVQQTTALAEEKPLEPAPAPFEPQPEAPAKEASEADANEAAATDEPASADAEKPSVDATVEPTAAPEVGNPAEPVEPVEPAPAEPALPVEPEEPNLFEDAEGDTATGEPFEEAPAESEDAATDVEPGDADAGEAPVVDEEAPAPDDSEPAADEPADEPPAPQADPFDGAGRSGEPLRRWIDRSGGYAVVAALVDVRADGTCVLDSAGRTLTVPLESLSDHDRNYAQRAQQRLAALRAAEPEASNTASM
ncbi:MAG: SHD1 domain-containing protein [Pirellulales bacterium]